MTTEAMFTADGDVVQVGRTRAVAAHFSIDTPAMLAALAGG